MIVRKSFYRRYNYLVILWASANILLLTVISVARLEYDGPNPLWWVGQLTNAPVMLLSEVLYSVGVDVRSYLGFLLMTLLIAAILIGMGLFFSKVRKRTQIR